MIEEKIDTHQVLQERYPQLEFLLNLYDSSESVLDESSQEDIDECVQQVISQKPSLILFIGIELWKHAQALETWLAQNPQSHVLLFEKDLGKIQAFLKESDALKMIAHPQMLIQHVLEYAGMEQALKEALQTYPSEYVFTKVHSHYQEEFPQDALDLMLFRKATMTSFLLREDQYYHVLSRNLLSNFTFLSSCFYADALKGQFQGIPAIICGAGPSLTDNIAFLKQAENKALILAGGSTIAALTTQGVYPHLGFAFDPNPEEYERLKANVHPQVPLLFGSRVLPSVFHCNNGSAGYMRTSSGGFVEQALEKKLGLELPPLHEGLSEEGMSVTIMCVAAAVHFGCTPIILCGIDLAYVDGKRYAQGVVSDPSVAVEQLIEERQASDRLLQRVNREGKEVYTSVKWIMEAATIEDFAKKHPESRFIDCVNKGLGFSSLIKKPLQQALQEDLVREYDLNNYVYTLINSCPQFTNQKKEIQEFLQELKCSFENSYKIVSDILKILATAQGDEEHPLMTLYTMDLEEEKAFQYFLQPLQDRMPYIWQQALREFSSDQKTQEQMFIEKKWKAFHSLIEYYLEIFKNLSLDAL